MRMFFCHSPHMVFDCRNAKNTLGSQAVRGVKAATRLVGMIRLQRGIVLAVEHLCEHYPVEFGAHVRVAFALGKSGLKKAMIVRWV